MLGACALYPCTLPPPTWHNGPPGGQDGGDAQDLVSRRLPRAAGPGGRCARQPRPAEQPSAQRAGSRCLWEPPSECGSRAGSQLWMLRLEGITTGVTGCQRLFSQSPRSSPSSVDLVSLWRRASEPAGEGQMACRRETRRFITASPRGPEGQAGLAGRSHTSMPVAVWPDREASWGQKRWGPWWGAGTEVREGMSGETSHDPGGFISSSHLSPLLPKAREPVWFSF